MSLTAYEQRLLDAIREARKQRRVMRSEGQWGVDLAGAYRVQAALRASPIKGYKLGLVSPAKQAQMGVNSPIYGRVWADMLRDHKISLGDFVQPRLEPELAIVLSEDIPQGAAAARAWMAVHGFFLALDILDSVWENYRFNAVEVVADNASGGAFIMGERLIPLEELEGAIQLYLNGALVAEGSVRSLADPGEMLAWLAAQVGGLRRGQVVFLGSPAASVAAQPGIVEISLADSSLLCWLEG